MDDELGQGWELYGITHPDGQVEIGVSSPGRQGVIVFSGDYGGALATLYAEAGLMLPPPLRVIAELVLEHRAEFNALIGQ
jgi:hypothetical protein